METREYKVHFLTPAFLGNADQSGQWRTPPFKALLRQWWRVAWAEANDFSLDHSPMFEQEGSLFGAASDGNGNRSRVRLRLGKWKNGSLDKWERDLKVNHPEVRTPIGSQLYLGYGPLGYDKHIRSTTLKINAAIQAGDTSEIRLAFPASDASLLDRALWLMHRFGSIGGRSRNGWGSFELDGISNSDASPPQRDWHASLDRDWPHAIGCDKHGPLVWQTGAFANWHELMRELAQIKIGLRTHFPFHSGRGTPNPEERHWLSYPVTNHDVRDWRNKRLPNSLRFKVRRDTEGNLRGSIFHVPCLPPDQFRPDVRTIESLWASVHTHLDQVVALERLKG